MSNLRIAKSNVVSKVFRVIRAIMGISRPRTWGPFVGTYEATKFDHWFNVSWSQGGEDLGLEMALRHIENGKYVDVGAHHPSRLSVTRKLSSRGWSGLNIDANPDLMAAFERDRPNDINLWNCVGTEKEYKLTIFEEPALSTVNIDWRNRFLSNKQRVSSEILVPGVTLEFIFNEYFGNGFPDLLCIDAEGADLNVLESANLKYGYGPKWLLLEADPPYSSVVETPAVKLALQLGYEIHLILSMSTLLVRN
jgi:FkbM family methyltransferase